MTNDDTSTDPAGGQSDSVRESSFLDQLRDAAIQFRFMEPWHTDKDFESTGGSIIYAVDADIFVTYGDPRETATKYDDPSKTSAKIKRSIGYGQVFDTDQPDLSIALSRRIVDHIFYGRQGKVLDFEGTLPLLIVPPIDIEIARLMMKWADKFGDQPSMSIDVNEFRKKLLEIDPDTQIENFDIDSIYEKVSQLIF